MNSSDRVLLMIDEAHRTQSVDLGDNLFKAFPNAPRLAYTGTPLIIVKGQKTTTQRFGDYIDKYKLQDAVDDKATVQILYEGKTADTAINDKAKMATVTYKKCIDKAIAARLEEDGLSEIGSRRFIRRNQ